MTFKEAYRSIYTVLRSRRGRNVITFCVFLVIATFLWWVIALNEEGQTDVRMPVKLTHEPDSITIISGMPQAMSVSIRARGSQLLKFGLGSAPEFNIDFRLYRVGSYLRLSDTDLKGIARSALGGAQVVVVSPDSLNIAFTTQPPVLLPVYVDYTATPGPQVALAGKPIISPDTVKVFVTGHRSVDVKSVKTEPVQFNSINESVTRRVRVIPPANSRVIPDSVDVTVKVDPLIFKTRTVQIESVNVPRGERLITFPTQVDVMYMIPVSLYLDTEPKIRVVADYNTISQRTGKVKIRVSEASDDLQNVHVATDSVEYIIER